MSVVMPRFLLTIFFPASVPRLVRGAVVKVFTLWASIADAVGSGLRPSLMRANFCCFSKPDGIQAR